MCFVNVKMLSRKQVNVFENREMRFGFLVLCFALMGHRSKQPSGIIVYLAPGLASLAWR